MSLSERLKKVRLELGETQKSMSRQLGLGDTTWQRYELDGATPGADVLEKVARLGFNGHWLLTGEGPMRAGDREERESAALSEAPPMEIDAALFGVVQEGVATIYREANMRLDLRALGEEAATIYNDLAVAYADPAERRIALKVLLAHLRRRLRGQAQNGLSKEAS